METQVVCGAITWWKDLSQIITNVATAVAVLGAGWAFFKWRAERYDRATEVLFRLQTRFDSPKLRRARRLLEDDGAYATIRADLASEVDGTAAKGDPQAEAAPRSPLDELDELLRFYVFVHAVRSADQVPDESLSTCFRFWLAHYHHPERVEFMRYVSRYFPTLRRWLAADSDLRRSGERGFFAPGDFGWPD